MANLFAVTSPSHLDAIVLTHGHVDHFADFVGIYHYRTYADPSERNLVLIAPQDVIDRLGHLITDSSLRERVDVVTCESRDGLSVRGLEVSWARVDHPVPCYGVRIEDPSDGAILAYSADSGPCDALSLIAAHADLFVCEATWLRRSEHHPLGLHLGVADSLEIARKAMAARVILTHVAYPQSPEQADQVARELALGQPYDVATDLMVYDTDRAVPDRSVFGPPH
jgi:ribonuclease BN (tRNA processing enzyme)